MEEKDEVKAVCANGVSERGAILRDEEAMRLVRYLVACGYSPSQVELAWMELEREEPAHG